MIPGKMVKGMGGAMDLVAGAKRVVVIMEHAAKDGAPKILQRVHAAADRRGVVHRIITDLAVIDVIKPYEMILVELQDDVTIEQVAAGTRSAFHPRRRTESGLTWRRR